MTSCSPTVRAHGDVAAKLEGLGKSIDSYPLTEMSNENDWMQIHNEIHQQEFEALGLTGLADMSEFDLSDRQQYDDFMWLHAAAHQAVNDVLGL